jgi:hypothetical protein
MAHDLNLGNVKQWQEQKHWSAAETTRWNSMRGDIKQTVRGSHVDIFVRLNGYLDRAFMLVVIAVGAGLLFVGIRVITAFTSGRVAQILETITKAN